MNELMVFENNNVEVLELNGNILFNPNDVAKCLGIKDVNSVIRNYSDKQILKIKNSDMHSMHFRKLNNTGENFLTESGVYKLIFKSRKENAEKFQDWVTGEVLPAIRKTGTYTVQNTDRSKSLEIKEMNAKVRMSNQFLKLAKVDTLSKEYKNILVSKATEVLTGEQLLPLPKSVQKTYTATELANLFGVSAQKIGALSNKHHLKTEEYGEWYRSKSQYSSKEVDTFVYYDAVLPVIESILGGSIAS